MELAGARADERGRISEIVGGSRQGFWSVRGTESNLLWTEVGKNRVDAVRHWLENQFDEPGLVGVKMISKSGRKRREWMSGHSSGRDGNGLHEKTGWVRADFLRSILIHGQDDLMNRRLHVAQVPMDFVVSPNRPLPVRRL